MDDRGKPKRTALIVGPPWPRSGSALVMQSQIDFYRSRGYRTVFVCVPLHCFWVESYPGWVEIKQGIEELGADQTIFASIDWTRFLVAKYTTWVKLWLQGTALDWIVFTAASAQIPADAHHALRLSEIALVHVNHLFTLQFAKRLLRQVAPSTRNTPIILETHDVQADALGERREINPWTHRYDSRKQLIRSELRYLKMPNVMVHLSEDDYRFFRERLPRQRHVLAMPTIDESLVSEVRAASGDSLGPIDLLFVGQSTEPNCAALKWFFEKVWPLIAHHGYSIQIVGRIAMLVEERLPDIYRAHRSSFVGIVRELASFYRRARCVFAPMRSGTGISMKTIEALALGKPFVGTSKAYRGMPMDRIIETGLEAYDTPEDFAGAIVSVLSDNAPSHFAEAGRQLYETLFSKQAAFAARDRALSLATPGRRSPAQIVDRDQTSAAGTDPKVELEN